jgi:hypothetical protein
MKTLFSILGCMLLLFVGTAYAHPPLDSTKVSFYLSIPDTTIFVDPPPVDTPGTVEFTVSGINDIFDGYTVTEFAPAFPTSRFTDMRRLYRVTANSYDLATDLKAAYPDKFPYIELIGQVELLSYTPNDFVIPNVWPVRSDYLDYIKARDAWGYTHGDPTIVIGITDTYLDVTHEDLQFQMAQVDVNNPNPTYPAHGTEVAGALCARTDNGMGYPSIGFNCRLHFSSQFGATTVRGKIGYK